MGLPRTIFTRRSPDDSNLEIMVNWHPGQINEMVSLADVGVGVSQVIPILTALIVAEPRQVVYIEQPEIHLHPKAHIGLVKAILEAANQGVKVIVETHSSTFLLALQTMIAERKAIDNSLNHDEIALYWFDREEDGAIKVVPGQLQENGTYGDWPVNFARVTMDLQMRFMKTFGSYGGEE